MEVKGCSRLNVDSVSAAVLLLCCRDEERQPGIGMPGTC